MWLAIAITGSVGFVAGVAARELAGGFNGSGTVLLYFIRKELRKMTQEITDRLAASDARATAAVESILAAVSRVQEDVDHLLEGMSLSAEQRAAWDVIDAKFEQIASVSGSLDPVPDFPPVEPPPSE